MGPRKQDPPEEKLFPVLDDLLADWAAGFRPPFEGIKVAGAGWSPGSHDVKDFLSRNQIPYKWMDVDHDPQAAALVEEVTGGSPTLPVVLRGGH